MINIEALEECCGCAACANVCPKQCITMHTDKKGFYYPHVEYRNCIDCNLCEKVCPFIGVSTPQMPIAVEAVRSISNAVVKESSSGGVCHELSSNFIASGGVVYGAAWSSNLTVSHVRVTDLLELDKIRCSKYLQSQTGDIYRQVKRDLSDGRDVLFFGTPCQVAGLKGYLRKDYSCLITVDFVCHGVPSQKVFNRTVAGIEKRTGGKVHAVNFRSKREGWRGFGTEFYIQDSDNQFIEHSKSFFFRGFMSNIYLRDCCHHCPFTGNRNHSDITVADLWGVEYVRPDIDDNTGLNLVLVRTQRGSSLLKECSSRLLRYNYDYKDALRYNPAMETPPKVHPCSNMYWKYLIHLPNKAGIFLTLLFGRMLRVLKKRI